MNQKGQATVEYLVVGLVLMAVTIALGTLQQKIDAGVFAAHASMSASHTLGAGAAGAIGDVFLY